MSAEQCNGEQSNLDWLAFQYVAGELNAHQHEAFELQLLESQAAREAVASAVELCQAVQAASALPASAPVPLLAARSSTWNAPAAWISLAAAACILLVASLQWFSQSDNIANGPAQQPTVEDTSLALVWSELRKLQSEEVADDAAASDAIRLATADGLSDDDLAIEDGSIEFDSADWILTALADREGDDPIEEPTVN